MDTPTAVGAVRTLGLHKIGSCSFSTAMAAWAAACGLRSWARTVAVTSIAASVAVKGLVIVCVMGLVLVYQGQVGG